jgi:hypothetical protein
MYKSLDLNWISVSLMRLLRALASDRVEYIDAVLDSYSESHVGLVKAYIP